MAAENASIRNPVTLRIGSTKSKEAVVVAGLLPVSARELVPQSVLGQTMPTAAAAALSGINNILDGDLAVPAWRAI
jgi:hypothetical protein